jgi:hypothetical protein
MQKGMGMAEIIKPIHFNDPFWLSYRSLIMLDPGSINLNTGSFGPTPQLVFNEAQENRRQLAAQPMDFLLRLLPPQLHQAFSSFNFRFHCLFPQCHPGTQWSDQLRPSVFWTIRQEIGPFPSRSANG